MSKMSILALALVCAVGFIEAGQFDPSIPASSIIRLGNPKQRGVGAAYYLITFQTTYSEADRMCRNAGYTLLSIESKQEQDTVVGYLNSNSAQMNYWTSGNDLENEGLFVWKSSNQPMALFTYFATPGNGNDPTRDCVTINGESQYNYHWYVNKCSDKFGFICEA